MRRSQFVWFRRPQATRLIGLMSRLWPSAQALGPEGVGAPRSRARPLLDRCGQVGGLGRWASTPAVRNRVRRRAVQLREHRSDPCAASSQRNSLLTAQAPISLVGLSSCSTFFSRGTVFGPSGSPTRGSNRRCAHSGSILVARCSRCSRAARWRTSVTIWLATAPGGRGPARSSRLAARGGSRPHRSGAVDRDDPHDAPELLVCNAGQC